MTVGWKSYADIVRARTQDLFRKTPESEGATSRDGEAATQPAQPEATLAKPVESASTKHAPFPEISEAKLKSVFASVAPSGTSQAACVRSALREMECMFCMPNTVAYRMDPCLLNQKSNTSEGYWLLAELLRRVAVESKDPLPVLTGGGDEAMGAPGSDGARSLPMRSSRAYEPYDVYAAVERKDIDTIMAIRDANFALLLGGDDARTPLEYAISLGPEYERVSLFLAGALSRFVNNLPNEMQNADPATLAVLRKVRANLKLAIDHSLGREQTSLVASYIQILVMAEGQQWVTQSARAVAYELRSRAFADPYAPRPTQVARDIVGRFLTQNLRTRRERDHYVVAAIEDYIANAASDLVLLALWDCVRGTDDPLPDYAFARDDRLSVAFVDAMTSAMHQGERRPHRIWVQAQRAAEALQGGLRGRTAHERLALLAQIVD